jgi:multidrug efflux system membrane fusion protein
MTAEQPKGSSGKLIWLVLIAAAAGGAYYEWPKLFPKAAPTTAQAAPAAVPVTTVEAQKTEFPVFLEGLGTVQAYNTVTVRTRVDGQVTKIAFKEGQMVAKGDLLAQIDPRPFQAVLDQAVSKKSQDEATLANSRADLARYSSLAKESFASLQQLDTQKAQVSTQIALVASDQAAIEGAQVQLDYTTISAPIAGRTGFRLIDEGNIVTAAQQTGVVTIAQLQPISVIFTAPEDDVVRINEAQAKAPLQVIAKSSDGTRTLATGKLETLNNSVDAATGTVRIKANFDNADNALWPGLSVTTRLKIGTLKDVVVIPDEALQRGPDGMFVYVIGNDGKADMRKIVVSNDADGHAVVAKGVEANERVVVTGQYRLQPGTLVAVNAPAAGAAPAASAQ